MENTQNAKNAVLAARLAEIKFTAKDFRGLHGLEFDENCEFTTLTRILSWELALHEDEDGLFLRFALVGKFKDIDGYFEEPFVLWISTEADANISDLHIQPTETQVNADDLEPLLEKVIPVLLEALNLS